MCNLLKSHRVISVLFFILLSNITTPCWLITLLFVCWITFLPVWIFFIFSNFRPRWVSTLMVYRLHNQKLYMIWMRKKKLNKKNLCFYELFKCNYNILRTPHRQIYKWWVNNKVGTWMKNVFISIELIFKKIKEFISFLRVTIANVYHVVHFC
jgi:hypothetical protein